MDKWTEVEAGEKTLVSEDEKDRTSRARGCSGVVACEFLLVYDSGGRTGGRLYIWNTEGSDRSGTSF